MAQIVPLNLLYERFPAKTKRFNELVVLIHHYGGNKHSFRRHIDWLNEIGYDCVTFDLPARSIQEMNMIPIDSEWNFGIRYIWAEAIERVLGSLPELKIIYSFSFPSISALMAIVKRHSIDVKGWITDGGPFKDVETNMDNLIRAEKLLDVKSRLLKNPRIAKAVTRISLYLSGIYHYDEDADRMLKQLPKRFPILSVRYEKDEIAAVRSIEKFFKTAVDHVDLRVLRLENSTHLMGFRDDAGIYQSTAQRFLAEWSTTP